MVTRLARGCSIVLFVTLASCSDSAAGEGGGGEPGSSSGDEGTSSGAIDTPSGSAAEICVATINEYRQKKGLAPYARWTEQESCADGEAKSDATTNRAHGAFGKCQEFAQNECPGWPGPAGTMIPDCLKAMWAEGPGGGHYEAMASTKYTKVACGFGTAGSGTIWSVQNFR